MKLTKAVCMCLVFAAGSVVCHSEWGSRNQLPREQDGDSVYGQQLWHLSLLGKAVYARGSPHQGRRLSGKEDLKEHLISFSNSKANSKNTRNNFCSLCSFLNTHLNKFDLFTLPGSSTGHIVSCPYIDRNRQRKSLVSHM